MKTSRSDRNEERLIGRRDDDVLERATAPHRVVVTHDLAFGTVEIRGGASFTKSC
jgi:hypothetical protein